ncbi:MAG: metallophosphoesterase [Oscillospiraceae bacterium]|nr:metallophosphoesterase [Oscillospiraceae bacterium]
MRVVVFSDSHGNYDVLEKIMERHKGDGDVFIHLGDGEREFELLTYVYNDKKLLFVSGNCDWGTDKPDYDIIKLGGKTIFFTHGARFGVKGDLNIAKLFARKNEADILLYGHTHIAETSYDDGLYIMNPGSCGRPREGLPSYGIIDITEAGIAMHTAEI